MPPYDLNSHLCLTPVAINEEGISGLGYDIPEASHGYHEEWEGMLRWRASEHGVILTRGAENFTGDFGFWISLGSDHFLSACLEGDPSNTEDNDQ